MSDRDGLIRDALAYIAASREFWKRDNPSRNFAFTLLEWAGNARRRATNPPAQRELF